MAAHLAILLVEDDVALRRTYERALQRAGHEVCSAGDVAEALQWLDHRTFDLAFVDYDLPDGNGADVVEYAVRHCRVSAPYCITGTADTQTVVAVTRAGCLDVFEKPVGHRRLNALIQQFIDGAEDGGADLDAWRERYAPNILGDSPALRNVLDVVRNVADSDATVLITGESGTGKELLARAVHDASPRRDRPFVALNCAAIPESLIEAELFGHTRGAFTGAVTAREGRIASADGGTLFLDEIGDMPLAAQAKLLRVLQEGTVAPIGSNDHVRIDIRVVAATNKDLEQLVEEGKFRADLYYRLAVIPVHLPPLRERIDDIPALAEAFVARASARNGRNVTGLTADALDALRRHRWPGNIRELMHTIERAVLLRRSGKLTARDIPLKFARGTVPNIPVQSAAPIGDNLDLRAAIDALERRYIEEALQRTGGNRTEAASLLGLNRTTLVEKIRKHMSA
ncbi:MAG: sigma-54-dependent Fis family transcriptional regulator [Deltaproteobacteria bacterium]|nr:MAG: sigma-54-dependent Fis family transcriptional regulator [Deltaproteobacteria bacterium]